MNRVTRGLSDEELRAHRAQAADQIDDLGLAGGVLEHRGALGERRGHDDVLGRADAGKAHLVDRALQPAGGAGELLTTSAGLRHTTGACL